MDEELKKDVARFIKIYYNFDNVLSAYTLTDKAGNKLLKLRK